MDRETMLKEYNDLQIQYLELVDKLYGRDHKNKDREYNKELVFNWLDFNNIIIELDNRQQQLKKLGYV